MKKKLVGALLLGAMFAGTAAYADCEPKFYVGAEVQANKYKGAKKLKTVEGTEFWRTDNKPVFGRSGSGASIMLGSRFNEYLGAELGATKLSKVKMHFSDAFSNSALRTKSNNLYADVLGYIPVSPEFDLIGSVGVGRLSSKVTGNLEEVVRTRRGVIRHTENVSMKSNKAGARVGAGVAYNIDQNLSARLMVRHQKGNKFIKSVTSAGLGLLYSF